MATTEAQAAPQCGAHKLFAGVTDGTRTDSRCKLALGHVGAHCDGVNIWSAAPPVGPVPERFRKPLGLSADPGSTLETLLAGLVACGRALGRLDAEDANRRHWQRVLFDLGRSFTGDEQAVDADWAHVGRRLAAVVRETADAQPSEPSQPIRDRAEALAVMIIQERNASRASPNFLIRAGVVLEVVRNAWRQARSEGARP